MKSVCENSAIVVVVTPNGIALLPIVTSMNPRLLVDGRVLLLLKVAVWVLSILTISVPSSIPGPVRVVPIPTLDTDVKSKSSLVNVVPLILPVNVVLPIATSTFLPIKSTDPNCLAPEDTKSLPNEVLRILRSWSFSNFSVGVKFKVFLLKVSTSAEKSPSFILVKSDVFSNMKALSVLVNTIRSLNWVSNVSGSIICTKYFA